MVQPFIDINILVVDYHSASDELLLFSSNYDNVTSIYAYLLANTASITPLATFEIAIQPSSIVTYPLMGVQGGVVAKASPDSSSVVLYLSNDGNPSYLGVVAVELSLTNLSTNNTDNVGVITSESFQQEWKGTF